MTTSQGTSNDYNKIRVQVIIPTLNEEQAIGELIDSIGLLDISLRVSVTSYRWRFHYNTLDICRRKNVKCIVQSGKGKGNAMREAVDQTDAEIVVFIDGDGTYSANDMGSMLKALLDDKSDMIVGSRFLSKENRGSVAAFNVVGNKIFNRTINFAMKSSITDSLSGYRALYTETFRKLLLFSNSFEIEVEMTVEALAKGLRILEVPITYGVRKGSSTKLDPFGDGIKIGRTLLFILMNINPLKFFGLISLAFFVIGLYPARVRAT